MSRPVAVPAACCLLLASGCGSPATDSTACPAGTAGASQAAWAERHLEPQLVELWRAGGLREGEALAFPVSVTPGPDHRVAVPDFRLGEVFVLGPDGSWEGSWTRQGEGPGEVLRPVATNWTEGGRLVAFDIEGARVVWLDSAEAASRTASLDPDFTGPVVAGGSLDWAAVTPDGRAFLRPGTTALPGKALAVGVVTGSRPGAEGSDTLAVDTLPTLSAEGRFARTPVPGAPTLTSAVTPHGSLLMGARDGSYRISRITSNGGNGKVVVCREVEPLPLTSHERGEGEFPEGNDALQQAVQDAPVPGSVAPFGRFFAGGDGRIWVQRERNDPAESGSLWGRPGATYDVFASDGGYLGSVEAPEEARLQAASGDTVWALEFGELDQASVVAYELRLRAEAEEQP